MNETEINKLITRLRKVEGQIRGICGMLYEKRSITDVMVQFEAAQSSLNSSVANYLELHLGEEKNGKITISSDIARTFLRQIKK